MFDMWCGEAVSLLNY